MHFLVTSLGDMPRPKATIYGNARVNGQPRHLGVLSCERGFIKISTSVLLIIRIGAYQSNYHLGASRMVGLLHFSGEQAPEHL
jgi:hypothetical protein